MTDLTRQYWTFTPDERFRLFVKAATRRDLQEMDRLNDSCPRRSYLTEDAEYTARKLKFFNLYLLHSIAVANTGAPALAALLMLVAFEGDEERTALLDGVEQAVVKLTVKRLSMIEAWRQFCEEIGLDSNDVDNIYGSERDWLMAMVDHTIAYATLAEITPDEAQVKKWLESWRESWAVATS